MRKSLYGLLAASMLMTTGGGMGMETRRSYSPPPRKPLKPTVPGDEVVPGMKNTIDVTFHVHFSDKSKNINLQYEKTIKISYTNLKNLTKKKIKIEHAFKTAIKGLSNEELLAGGVIIKGAE